MRGPSKYQNDMIPLHACPNKTTKNIRKVIMKLKTLLLVAALTTATPLAIAQSNAFEGAYGQLGFGYGTTSVPFTGGRNTVSSTNYSTSAGDTKSISGTLTAGYNFAVSSTFILGVGAESEYSPFSSSKANYTTTSPSSTAQYEKNNTYNFFVSPGLVIDKDRLAYAKVGYAKTSLNMNNNSSTNNYKGYSLGLGYKQMVDTKLYGFAEVNYAKYDSQSDGAGLTGTNNPHSVNVLVGAGYRL